jgi:hypothetical protein
MYIITTFLYLGLEGPKFHVSEITLHYQSKGQRTPPPLVGGVWGWGEICNIMESIIFYHPHPDPPPSRGRGNITSHAPEKVGRFEKLFIRRNTKGVRGWGICMLPPFPLPSRAGPCALGPYDILDER